eukprot:PITA_26647
MSLGLRVEDRLDGHTNYSVWKERMQSIFEEAKIWDIMVHTTQNPVVMPTDATLLAAYNRKNNKGKTLILDGVKGHCIPHVRGKRNAHEMWTALSNLYQSTNENRKMVLKEKLKTIKMGNDSTVGYLTKIINVQREHAFPSISRASSGIWYVDSGASRHMTGVREYFSELSESGIDIEVVFGDDRVVRAVGVGTLTFQRESKPPLKVTDVLYVPGIRKNLISVSALEDRGYEVLFRGGQVLMYPKGTPADSARVIGVRHAKVYKFAFQSLLALSSSTNSRASSSELCEIWHCRMEHMYHGALRTLREITTGVPDFSTNHFDTCRGCAMGKFVKSPFPSSDNRAIGILDLIHSDEFRALVETQTGRKIKSLRLDNGGEYTLGEFVDYCAEAGIRREFTVPYDPQQNGVAERKNRSIIGAAKAMLHDQGLPLFLWEEACNTAVYLQNRKSASCLGHMTPEEAFSGKKPDIGHLHIFGCITYSYIPKEKRTN